MFSTTLSAVLTQVRDNELELAAEQARRRAVNRATSARKELEGRPQRDRARRVRLRPA